MCVSGSLTLVLRNFAKNLEGWLDIAMTNVAKEMVQAKVILLSLCIVAEQRQLHI